MIIICTLCGVTAASIEEYALQGHIFGKTCPTPQHHFTFRWVISQKYGVVECEPCRWRSEMFHAVEERAHDVWEVHLAQSPVLG